MMEAIKNNSRIIVAFLIGLGILILLVNAGDNETQTSSTTITDESSEVVVSEEGFATGQNVESESTDTTSSEIEESETSAEKNVVYDEGTFSVEAVSGDNQTVLVREIINTYLEDQEDVSLNDAQKLFVETNLVNGISKSDVIHVGEEISLNEEALTTLVQEAQELSEAAQSRWAVYL